MRRVHRLAVVVLAALIAGTLGTATATVAVRRASTSQPSATPTTGPLQGLATLASVPAAAGERLLGIATFGPSTRVRGDALADLGLDVLPMRELPLALVSGTKAQLEAAVRKGVALDVYPDEKLVLHSAESTAAIGADTLRDTGLRGRGVGVAVVDTGIDATHPDLADHVTHNMKLVGPEILDVLGGKHRPDEPPGTLVVPMDGMNSDTTSGHGTHVAGIVAGDAHTSPDQVGVAPDADLIGYGTGDAISIFTVLAAFDDILVHHLEWGIRVVNNSWGQSGRLFDPNHPINVATRALHDAGLVVVFSAGNDGAEGTINPYSVAPWVISAGSANNDRDRSAFSSGGYEHDNSTAAPVPDDRHLRFDGDRIGIYHPDVSAPGTDIVSSGTPTGIGTLSPALPGGTATLSGTSMAAPHVSGVAALLFEARPSLTPDQVRQVLQVTAAPMRGEAEFFESGYGFTDAAAAVALVRRPDFSQALLDRLQAAADDRVLRARSFSVRASDLWAFSPELPATVSGLVSREFATEVAAGTDAVRAVVSYPSLALVGINPFDWQVSVTDAAGKVVGTSTPSATAGVSTMFAEIDPAAVRYGTWKVTVTGVLGAADTDALIGNAVTVAVAQVARRTAEAVGVGPRFVPEGSATLHFQGQVPPAVPLPVPLSSPEGCVLTQGAVDATMGGSPAAGTCTSGVVGWALGYGLEIPATFTSPALPSPAVVGGPSNLRLWLADPAAAVWTAAFASRVGYVLDAVAPDGTATSIAAGDMERRIDGADEVRAEPTRADYAFTVSPSTVPVGSRLRLKLSFSGAYASGLRMLFGGAYADSGLTLGVGRMEG
ncbi:MAG TPA: S8 family serine peptidase [Acidimicrobiales bacterium]|jgi:serine protease AprX|nr:S8 family serine peptidase [Acidimicrobiales bacterium]